MSCSFPVGVPLLRDKVLPLGQPFRANYSHCVDSLLGLASKLICQFLDHILLLVNRHQRTLVQLAR